MKRIVVQEHTQIVRWDGEGTPPFSPDIKWLEHRLYDRLKRFDQRGRAEKDRVFSWGDRSARTTQWVGVIQVPGLQVEILPKIDEADFNGKDGKEAQARRNLLYMLSVAGQVPVRERDVARLTSRKASLSETLAAIFADRLRRELLRGPERAYIRREENLRKFKGKLLIAQQVRHNAAHRERFFCRFDEFSEDTLMNRIFRAACRVLLNAAHTPSTQDRLRHCLLLLDGVEDVFVHDELFDQITITRQNERFVDVLHFCRLILQGRSPTVQAGRERSFSLLFDMNRVFEDFVTAFLKKQVIPHLDGYRLYPQAKSQRRHLMRDRGRGVLLLQPDILITSNDLQLVLDTKWKQFSGTVGSDDLYQLYAYTKRYECQRSVLLYPQVSEAKCLDFDLMDTNEATGEQVGVRFVNLRRDLHKRSEKDALACELVHIVQEGFPS